MELEPVLRDLAPRVLRFAIALTRDRDLSEDVAQESLAALIQRWRRGGPPESPAAYVFAVARRRAARRLLRRRLFVPLEFLSRRAGNGRDPEAQFIENAAGQVLAQSLDRLPGSDRQALLLAATGELSTREGALALGISESAYKMRVHRARLRLTALLEEHDDHSRP